MDNLGKKDFKRVKEFLGECGLITYYGRSFCHPTKAIDFQLEGRDLIVAEGHNSKGGEFSDRVQEPITSGEYIEIKLCIPKKRK